MSFKTRRILWSGGFDSTFLVVDALARGDTVEPFYVQQASEPVWQKQRRECAALEQIVSLLPMEYRRRLRKGPREPFIMYRDVWSEYRKFDKELSELAGHRDEGYSPQAPMLAAISYELHGVECAFVADDFSVQNEVSRLFLAAHEIATPLAGWTKRDILRESKRRGFRQLLDLTWSCEGTAIEAEDGPCGACDPCRARIIPARAAA